jgi:hypothetical protein
MPADFKKSEMMWFRMSGYGPCFEGMQGAAGAFGYVSA